jgi:MFS family permease
MLAQGVLGGISAGMTMAPAMAATGQYFNKKRAAALGMAIAGSSLGGVTFPVALGKMLYNPKLGFGWSVRICGFIMLAILVPASTGIRARLPPRKKSFFLPSAFKEAPYVAIVGALLLMMLGCFIPFFYLPSYAVQHGMSSELASYLISILNGASFFGRVIPGILADKLGRLNMLCVVAFSSAILIFCWPKIITNASIIVFSGLYGFCSGAIISLMAACLAQAPKDPRNIGTYMGMGMAVAALAALIGPPINGALLNRYNGFDQASIFSGVVVSMGGAVALLAKQVSGKGLFAKI